MSISMCSRLLALGLLARNTAAQNGTTECSQSWCTSPDGYGGYDCWAGTYEERCTCSQGEAVISSGTLCVEGIVYYEYRCCVNHDAPTDGEHLDGEQCANFNERWERCSLWTGFSFLRVIRYFLFPLFVIIALGSWAQRRRRMMARRQHNSHYNSRTHGAAHNAPIREGIQMPVGFGQQGYPTASAAQPVHGVPVTGVPVATTVSSPDQPTMVVAGAVPVGGTAGAPLPLVTGHMVVPQAVAVSVAATPQL